MNQQQVEVVQTACIFFTVQQFTKKHSAFTIGGIRSLIFHEQSNGLAESGAIVRIGRKVLIDEGKFFGWVESIGGRARGIYTVASPDGNSLEPGVQEALQKKDKKNSIAQNKAESK
ncbi:MAG: hypothetical protein WC856_15140 [Methylococcaceae bacterium]|jgi:hypothetical protein